MIATLRSRISLRALGLSLLLAGCTTPRSATVADPATVAFAAAVRAEAHPLTGGANDYDPLLELIGDARVVLLGEATHGTHEFYRERARITRRLIEEKGFSTVAVEADWPDALPVNRYVRRIGDIANARRALAGFDDFPAWMWRNAEVLELVRWLRDYNAALPPGAEPVGFYGIDLQVITPAVRAVIDYLEPVDPAAAERARRRYACFGRYASDPVGYGQAIEFGAARACTEQVAEQARELAALPGREGDEEFFHALQSARMLERAEEYFRAMFLRAVSPWNLRDRYMADVVETLLGRGKVVVWAHNSHVGDARATHMADQGELNLGELARERWGEDAVLVGFTTYAGTVIAASDWGGPALRKRVRPALPESFESIFHHVDIPAFLLLLRESEVEDELRNPPRLERAIGVIYLPQTERLSHYFHARLWDQFDALIHWDETRALEPLR